jgi:phosphoenolpyruvate-protein kinase (PTS system EI component)
MTSGASLRGHPASSGVAVGPAWLRAETKAAAGTPAEERARVERGLRAVADELAQLAGRLRGEGRSADAEIVEANLLMSEDAALV